MEVNPKVDLQGGRMGACIMHTYTQTYNAIQFNTIKSNTTQYNNNNAMQYNTLQNNTSHHNTNTNTNTIQTQHNTMQYNTIHACMHAYTNKHNVYNKEEERDVGGGRRGSRRGVKGGGGGGGGTPLPSTACLPFSEEQKEGGKGGRTNWSNVSQFLTSWRRILGLGKICIYTYTYLHIHTHTHTHMLLVCYKTTFYNRELKLSRKTTPPHGIWFGEGGRVRRDQNEGAEGGDGGGGNEKRREGRIKLSIFEKEERGRR
jgi:hypothetical protein